MDRAKPGPTGDPPSHRGERQTHAWRRHLSALARQLTSSTRGKARERRNVRQLSISCLTPLDAGSLARRRTSRIPHAFHKLSLVALLAWVGLGADGLSSSAPTAPTRRFARSASTPGLAVLPRAGDGADRLHHQLRLQPHHRAVPVGRRRLRRRHASSSARASGVVSGAALLVDYVLTITISIACGRRRDLQLSAAESAHWLQAARRVRRRSALLTVMNIRGVKESVTALVPIFVLFVVTHAILLVVAIGGHAGRRRPRSPARCTRNVGRTVGGARHVRRAQALRARVLAGRRHLHRHRGRLERRRHDARAARADREAHDGPDGRRRSRSPPAASSSATCSSTRSPKQGKTMNAVLLERVAGALDDRRPPRRARLRHRRAAQRGRAPLRRRAGGLPRRAARHGEHGDRLVAPAPLRGALRAAVDAQRRAADGRRRGRRAPLHARRRRRSSSSCTRSTCS